MRYGEIIDKARTVRKMRGVYFLLYKDDIVYVGQSDNIICRVGQHFADKEFDSYSFVECSAEEIDHLEASYILMFKPKYNDFIPCPENHLVTDKQRVDVVDFKPNHTEMLAELNPAQLVDTKRAARFMGLKESTLEQWRVYGKGPEFVKMGRSVRYRVRDLQQYLDTLRAYPSTTAYGV